MSGKMFVLENMPTRQTRQLGDWDKTSGSERVCVGSGDDAYAHLRQQLKKILVSPWLGGSFLSGSLAHVL